jgi:hypothetical protein
MKLLRDTELPQETAKTLERTSDIRTAKLFYQHKPKRRRKTFLILVTRSGQKHNPCCCDDEDDIDTQIQKENTTTIHCVSHPV